MKTTILSDLSDAEFGDKFVTRSGEIVLFNIRTDNSIWFFRDEHEEFETHLNGKMGLNSHSHNKLDIIEKYKEPIDEQHLEKLAFSYKFVEGNTFDVIRAFKDGYRKAKEEL